MAAALSTSRRPPARGSSVPEPAMRPMGKRHDVHDRYPPPGVSRGRWLSLRRVTRAELERGAGEGGQGSSLSARPGFRSGRRCRGGSGSRQGHRFDSGGESRLVGVGSRRIARLRSAHVVAKSVSAPSETAGCGDSECLAGTGLALVAPVAAGSSGDHAKRCDQMDMANVTSRLANQSEAVAL